MEEIIQNSQENSGHCTDSTLEFICESVSPSTRNEKITNSAEKETVCKIMAGSNVLVFEYRTTLYLNFVSCIYRNFTKPKNFKQ